MAHKRMLKAGAWLQSPSRGRAAAETAGEKADNAKHHPEGCAPGDVPSGPMGGSTLFRKALFST